MTGVLFGDEGKRSERVEWGTRATVDSYIYGKKGAVSPCADERQARGYNGANYPGGPKVREAVRRVVVTYTGPWEPA